MENHFAKSYIASPHFPHLHPSVPILTYRDIKHLKVFAVTRHWSTSYKKLNGVACLFIPDNVRLKDYITLEESLKLLRTCPSLFTNPSILARLYSFVSLYDRNVHKKIESRVRKEDEYIRKQRKRQ